MSCNSLDGGTLLFSGQFMQRIFRSTREFFPVRVGLIKVRFFFLCLQSVIFIDVPFLRVVKIILNSEVGFMGFHVFF